MQTTARLVLIYAICTMVNAHSSGIFLTLGLVHSSAIDMFLFVITALATIGCLVLFVGYLERFQKERGNR